MLLDARGTARLADFGLARSMRTGTVSGGLGGGTPGYMAPEVLRSGGAGSLQGDVFSAGVLFVELLTGAPPYAHLGNNASAINVAVTKGERPIIPTATPHLLAKLMKGMWEKEPRHRPKALRVVVDLEEAESGLSVGRRRSLVIAEESPQIQNLRTFLKETGLEVYTTS